MATSTGGDRDGQIQTARLCEGCQELSFDDEDWGGYEGVSPNGEGCLQFNDDNQYREFYLYHTYTDTFPDLPILRKCALECDMCGYIRHILLSKQFARYIKESAGLRRFKQEFELCLTLRWKACKDYDPVPGLSILSATVYMLEGK
jgi:hypothetical protein